MPSAPSRTAPSSRATGCNVITKIVFLFLIVMGGLAMFGKLRVPGAKRLASAKCKNCGRYRIGKGPCPCTRKVR